MAIHNPKLVRNFVKALNYQEYDVKLKKHIYKNDARAAFEMILPVPCKGRRDDKPVTAPMKASTQAKWAKRLGV